MTLRNAIAKLTVILAAILSTNLSNAATIFVPPNGDFSSTTLGHNSSNQDDLDAGWFAKNANPPPAPTGNQNWAIQGGVLDNIAKNGSRTRAGNYFTFNNTAGTGTGWSLEFDLGGTVHTGGDNLLRVWAGKLAGAPSGNAFNSGNNNPPDNNLVDGVWDEIVNFSLASSPLGHKTIAITDDITSYDAMVIKIRHQTSGGPTYDNFQFTNPAGGSAIPEPSTFALAALGLFSLGLLGWRRRNRSRTSVLRFVALFSCIVVASTTNNALADIVNGDFSVNSLPARGNSPYSDLNQGWVAKNAGTNWTIQPGEFLEQLSNSGTATRVGQFFSAGDLMGEGWSLEFDLAVDNLSRVQLFAGVDDGNNTTGQTVFGTGGDGAPNNGRVVGSWTTLIDTGNTTINSGHIVMPFTEDLSDFDVMVVRFRGNGATVSAQIDNVELVQVAPIPEPATFALAGFGLFSLGLVGWRRRRPTVKTLRHPFTSNSMIVSAAILSAFLVIDVSQGLAASITAFARSGVDVGTNSSNPNNGGIFTNSFPVSSPANAVGTVTTSVTNGNANGNTPLTWTFNVVDTATLADFDFDVTVTALHDNTTGTWTIGAKRGSAPAVNSPGGSNQERNRTEALNAGGYAEYMRMSVGNVQVNSGPDIVFTGIEAITLTNITAVDTGTVNASSLTNDPGAVVITTWANQTPANNRLELPLGVTGVTSVDIIPTADWHQLRGGIFNFETVEAAVPEPSTFILAALAMLALIQVTFRRRKRNG